MKIKVLPEDFLVREIVDLPLSEEGRHRAYIMMKRGWNTVDAIKHVARVSGIPASSVTYAGLKDRHAVTYQHLSIPREFELRSDRDDIRLVFIGFSDDFVSTRVLAGNSFEMTVRSISGPEEEFILERLPEVRRQGFPNYFDDQRFGTVSGKNEFLAERLVKGHLRGALKMYLAAEHPGQDKTEIERRQAISSQWGDWPAVLSLCRTKAEAAVVQELTRGETRKNLLTAVNRIPRDELTMFLAAFQSFIWNRSLQVLLQRCAGCPDGEAAEPGDSPAPGAFSAPSLFSVDGKAGPYVFYRQLPGSLAESLVHREIPTVARRLLPCPSHIEDAVMSVLAERGVSLREFGLRGVRTAYFRSFQRQAAVVPGGFKTGDFDEDDLYKGRKKLRLEFSLPRGSYATMLLKSITKAAPTTA